MWRGKEKPSRISNIEEEIKGPKLVLFLIPILKAHIKAKN